MLKSDYFPNPMTKCDTYELSESEVTRVINTMSTQPEVPGSNLRFSSYFIFLKKKDKRVVMKDKI